MKEKGDMDGRLPCVSVCLFGDDTAVFSLKISLGEFV